MTFRTTAIPALFLLLIVMTSIGLFVTRESAPAPRAASSNRAARAVDETPLSTARALASLATTRDEQRLVREAARLADHEIDLAFADALREAAEHPVQVDPALRQRIQRLEGVTGGEQAQLDDLKKRLPTAKPADAPALQEQIALLDAQKALDDDELQDARQDLIRSGGDPVGTIQRLRDAHEAAQHDSGAPQAAAASAPVDISSANLAGQIRATLWLRDKRAQLASAQADANRLGALVAGEHQALEQHVDAENAQQTRENTSRGTAATLSALKHSADDQKSLSDFDQRILDERELATVYGTWIDSVATQERALRHAMLQSALWILLIGLAVFAGSQGADHYLKRSALQRRGLSRLRAAVRFALQAIGALIVICIVFGVPSSPATVFGLAGAGLTIALQDFIVGFLGWFILMGRNGLHVGDWVEINGVAGEVIEIGLLRTVLMETGNWTESGYPTGRKVAFVNSFAIAGHYFNFSTSGQWMWDELQLLVPPGRNPYQLADAVRHIVEEESREQSARAEEEWRRSTSHDRLRTLSVEPAIELRPTAAGVEMRVRYITSASERSATRTRMYQRIMDVMMHAETVR